MSGRQTVLVTGAAGFVGRHACAYFSEGGFDVVAAVHRPNTAPDGCEEAVCDLTDPDAAARLVAAARPGFVLHLAGRNAVRDSWAEPALHLQTNLMGTVHLLDALRRGSGGCRVLIVGSMLDSFGPSASGPDSWQPSHPYSLSKTFQALAALAWARLYGQDIMLAQPSNMVGPGHSGGVCALLARYIAELEEGSAVEPFRLSSRGDARDYVDVRDAVRAFGAILSAGERGKAYPIGSGRMRTLVEVADAFGEAAGLNVPIRVTGEGGASAPAREPDPLPMMELGWQPRIPFAGSVRDILTFYRAIVRPNSD